MVINDTLKRELHIKKCFNSAHWNMFVSINNKNQEK